MQSRLFRTGWKFLDILFPPCCAGCGEWGKRYCSACIANTKIISSTICQICGEPISLEGGSICERCKVSEISFAAVRSWALYEYPLKRAIHQLKYQRNIGLGEVLANPLAVMVEKNGWDIDLITAVPLDKNREQERGFNQSILLARPLSWLTNLPFSMKAVRRTRETKSQVGLSREERKDNLIEAFKGSSEIVNGKTILVVDDVITTGSTLNSCSKAMIESGAERVFGLTLARSALL